MEEHMAYLVYHEKRPFSYRDFMRFEVSGKEYTMTHGTCRNKLLKLKKVGRIEVEYNTGIAFYTLKDQRFGNRTMTPDHAKVSYDPIARQILNLPMDKSALHDIRLKFEVKGIWSFISNNHLVFP
jgi:hypothetical protein